MTDLIQRIEAAKEPRRELFEEAFKALGNELFSWDDWHHPDTPAFDLWANFDDMLDAQAWTSAAEMLVPPTFRQTLKSWDDGYAVGLWRGGRFYVFATKDQRCAHPSLALLAAILRAERKDDE